MSTWLRQTAVSPQDLFSLLLSYFVAQYVLMWCNFLVKIYFSFGEMIFFVRPLKYANFHREYYPSCVTSCNEFDLRYFCQHNPLFYHLNLRWSSTHILKIFNINWVQFMMVPLETSSKSAANCTSDWHFVTMATSFQAPKGEKRYLSTNNNIYRTRGPINL